MCIMCDFKNNLGYYPSPEFTRSEEYKKWAEDKPPEFNAYAFLRMTEERTKATRLEF